MVRLAVSAAVLVVVVATAVQASSFRNIVGFHLGPGGDHDNVMTYLQTLDAHKIPFAIKDVDEYGTLAQAAAMRAKSGVDHQIVWRSTNTDTVNFNNDPKDEAAAHWEKVMSVLPAGFDKDNVWLEVINEPDQSKCEWLAQFGVATAAKSMAAGFKLLMFGFATGNPYVGAGGGPMCWNQTDMAQFLTLASQNPDRLGVALHEYSLTTNIQNEYPYLIGRLHFMMDVCKELGITPPTTMITEWGWGACAVHLPPSAGIQDIDWVQRGAQHYYAQYPSLKAAFMWYLGPWSCPISKQADQLVLPVLNYTISTYGQPTDVPLPDTAAMFQL